MLSKILLGVGIFAAIFAVLIFSGKFVIKSFLEIFIFFESSKVAAILLSMRPKLW
jgi:hypothetical protein